MRHLFPLLFLFGCMPDPRPEMVDPPAAEPVAPEPETVPVGPAETPAAIADNMYELGRESVELEQKTEAAKKQLYEARLVLLMRECMVEKLGVEVDGDMLLSHMRRKSKPARSCQKKVMGMTEAEVTAEAEAVVSRHEEKRG